MTYSADNFGMQRRGLDPLTMSALLPVLDLAGWEEISACVNAVAYTTSHSAGSQFETVLQGFLALLVLQGTLAKSAHQYMLQICAAIASCNHSGIS